VIWNALNLPPTLHKKLTQKCRGTSLGCHIHKSVIFKSLIFASLVFSLSSCRKIPEEIQAKDLKPGDFVIFNAQMKGLVTFVKNEAGSIVVSKLIDETEIEPKKEHRTPTPIIGFGKYRPEEAFRTYQPSMEFRVEAEEKLRETAAH